MKLSTNQYFNNLSRYLSEQQGKIALLQAKLATGDKLTTPSAAPQTAAKSLDLQSLLARQEGYLDNLARLDGRLQQEEVVVAGMRNMLGRMQELAVRAANDTYNLQDRQAMAVEVRGYIAEIIALANSKDNNGSYYFAGVKSSIRPFEVDASNQVTYHGDDTRITIEIDAGNHLAINTTGNELLPGVSRTVLGVTSVVSPFTVMNEFAAAMETADSAGISQAIGELDAITTNLEQLTVGIGLRRTIVDNSREITEGRKLALTSMLSAERDLDYTAAVTELSAEMLALEAAQSSFAKIAQLNLFNYLR